MKDSVLLELAARWQADAEPPKISQGTVDPVEQAKAAHALGVRETKRECADGLRMLVQLLDSNVI